MEDESEVVIATATEPQSHEQILEAYKKNLRERKARRKEAHKAILLEYYRNRKYLLLDNKNDELEKQLPPIEDSLPMDKRGKFRLHLPKRFNFPLRVGKQQSQRDPSKHKAGKTILRVMKRYCRLQTLAVTPRRQRLAEQNKLLFDECGKCIPLARGPTISDDGILQLAGPDLPKIEKILYCKDSIGMDLQKPHGISLFTAMHVVAQRGYTDVAKELLEFWASHPTESPYQSYSIILLRTLHTKVLALEKDGGLLSDASSELQELISQLGVSFAYFIQERNKLHGEMITIQDLLTIFGHPLVLRQDATGNTPLHYAAEGGYIALCRLFLENGANVNAQNNAGETAMHYAISSGHDDVCLLFVENKVDVCASRYVDLSLTNGVQLLGSFVDFPGDAERCYTFPIYHTKSSSLSKGIMYHLCGWKRHKSVQIAPGNANLSHNGRAKKLVHRDANDGNGISTTVKEFLSSLTQQGIAHRDVYFFRTAPGSVHFKPGLLVAIIIGDHVVPSEATKSRNKFEKAKILHLLIQNAPSVALKAFDSFHTPLFRCNLLDGARDLKQQWGFHEQVASATDMLKMIVSRMAHEHEGRSPRRRARRPTILKIEDLIWLPLYRFWRLLWRIRRFLSVQNIFATSDPDDKERVSIVREPKGILYEYVYDHAEFRGRYSPTLSLIIQTECKDLIRHAWVRQLINHKWNTFAKQTFRSEFHIYFIYFLAVFLATYLHVGDVMLGMPLGGYRASLFSEDATWPVYIRDGARIVYSAINYYYTVQEVNSYRQARSLWTYLQDGWNWFDMLQIACVWMLLVTDIKGMFDSETVADTDYTLYVYPESQGEVMWRKYNLRTTLMSIVGPQIFIKWIQFARGNRLLGPFVRMIFKMFTDIFLFLFVFGLFMCGFAFAFFILQIQGYLSYFSSMTSVFQMSVGEWDWDAILHGGPLAVLLFVLYVIIGTIMLLNLLIAMLGNTYNKIWDDNLLFFELERAKATLSIQRSVEADEYDDKYWCSRLYVLEDDAPIEGIQFQKF